jgi:hypothetical protein
VAAIQDPLRTLKTVFAIDVGAGLKAGRYMDVKNAVRVR